VARKKVQLRREEIIEAMIVQMRDRGIAETRVADVAAALGVSSGLIFYHFETKEALLLEALPRAMERDLADVDAIVVRNATALRRLKALVKLYGPSGDAAEWRLWIDSWGAALRDEQIAAMVLQIDGRWRAGFHTLLTEGVEAGEFSCPDPEATAARITALLDGLAIQKIVRREQTAKAKTEAWVAQFLDAEITLSQS
jgi:AcrR family transcriptional regulator